MGPIFGEAVDSLGDAEGPSSIILAYLSPDSPALGCLAGAASCGMILAEHDAGIAMAATVRRAVDQPAMTAAASAFAERHRGYDPAMTTDTVAGTLVDYVRNFGGSR